MQEHTVKCTINIRFRGTSLVGKRYLYACTGCVLRMTEFKFEAREISWYIHIQLVNVNPKYHRRSVDVKY